MVIKKETRGILLSLLGAIAVSNVYIFSKAALKETHLAQFGFYWFGLGLLWNLLYSIKGRKVRTIRKLQKQTIWALIVIGLLEVGGTTFFFTAIQVVENPAIVSFLANFNPFFVTLLGIIILREQFGKYEIAGIALTLAGAFIISYKGNTEMGKLFTHGTEYIIISAVLFSSAAIIAKKNIMVVDPVVLSISRSTFLLLFSFIMMCIYCESFVIPVSAAVNISIGSLLGPFLTVFTSYLALKYIGAGKASIVRSSRSLFVLLGAYIYFNTLPYDYQIIGGLFTIAGVILISTGSVRRNRRLKRIQS
ncbi:MAG: DMT family transporter [Bacteroidales bacterium]|nr:DMT family transporter [Bacteroidales bacterium]MCF8375434.1 DMT family transporter [Bacteroidales bacterium]MCF8400982.1 DMT family transporter [Bacteroidales bacterium]